MNPETIAARTSHHVDPETGAILAPIHPSTTFERDADGQFPSGYVYARVGNPNRQQLEEILSQLEGGSTAAAFSSGSAATAAVFQSLSAGDHIVAPEDCYHGTAALLHDVFARWGLESTFTDVTDPEKVKQAIRPNTKLVWVETPSNPILKITDIALIAGIAHDAGALCVCDNTWATPLLQRPLDLGADLVVHSTTKYLGGHSDVLGGAVVARSEEGLFQLVQDFHIPVLWIAAIRLGFNIGPPHMLLSLGEGPGTFARHGAGLAADAAVNVNHEGELFLR